jgi:hypothetical protein
MKNYIFHWNTFNPSEHNKKIFVTEQDFANAENLLISTWNFWCNLKCFIPDLDCYLLEFSNMINKYSHLTGHKEIPYNKKELIINYGELKTCYEQEYQKRWEALTNKGIAHLTNMHCKTDLDDLDLSK